MNKDLVTGISVLAWPRDYFHNYKQLLKTFNLQEEPVKLPFSLEDTKSGVKFI